jgi:hypothetical protein
MWNPFRRKKKWGLEILVPDGISKTASVKFLGCELRGIQKLVFEIAVGEMAQLTLYLAPGMTKVFASSISLRTVKYDEWKKE